MNPFSRNKPDPDWLDMEAQWTSECANLSPAEDVDHWGRVSRWQRARVSAAELFHKTVRPPGHPSLCAYCDGDLGPQSPETIDHFLPQKMCIAQGRLDLILSWLNLFPSCYTCNTKAKRGRWSDGLIRPDSDQVDQFLYFDLNSGEIRPRPGLDGHDLERAQDTIDIFGLNAFSRPEARKFVVEHILSNARDLPNFETIRAVLARGPYRFVVRAFVDVWKIRL